MKSLFTKDQINAVMEQRGINRKSALKFLNREHAFPSRRPRAGMAAAARAKDVKMEAANDKAVAKVVAKAPTDAGKTRSAGVQLFILAGRPTRSSSSRCMVHPGA
jgi:hypothetical protein